MRASVYLHEELDLAAATAYWSALSGIPVGQFTRPYVVKRQAKVRTAKHLNGCCYLTYSCSRTHRAVMGLVRALLSSEALPG